MSLFEKDLDDLLALCANGLGDLLGAAEASVALDDRERDDVRRALEDDGIRRLVDSTPELREAIDGWMARSDEDREEAKQQLDRLHRATKVWSAGLAELRALPPE
ncbi:hypothetical protein [Kribbia dieselivorans]|uniref:hypothetical protein n=1 Tax=Kribbia dieselivorans TaxID=331526 RepID=UPI000838A5FA|nr:hypothetical protein [Kribbia dieselivorans]